MTALNACANRWSAGYATLNRQYLDGRSARGANIAPGVQLAGCYVAVLGVRAIVTLF
ncbi:hypothetical protein [Burkholderia catarinensis]|uniref:hypothetical protein n=1 Tax=Burkholderia catarinensis TaxID=1108140 RepID=UPI001300E952|nr:hypothetical protein [Burkholderia catarinensis]